MRELALKRGDNLSIINASVGPVVYSIDHSKEEREIQCIMPHNSRILNVENYQAHLRDQTKKQIQVEKEKNVRTSWRPKNLAS